jgi:hypothetical protein
VLNDLLKLNESITADTDETAVPGLQIRCARFPQDEECVQDLSLEYDLRMQRSGRFLNGFGAELVGLPGIYAAPRGRVLIASRYGRDIGCAALACDVGNVCRIYHLFALEADAALVQQALIEAACRFAGTIGAAHVAIVNALEKPSALCYPPTSATTQTQLAEIGG